MSSSRRRPRDRAATMRKTVHETGLMEGGSMVDEYLDILAGGDWITGHSGEIFEDRNPADHGDLIAIFARGDAVDIDDAVQAAKHAYPAWMRTRAHRRADHVRE